VTDAAAFAQILISIKIAVCLPADRRVRTVEIAQRATGTYQFIPDRFERLFNGRKGLNLSVFYELIQQFGNSSHLF